MNSGGPWLVVGGMHKLFQRIRTRRSWNRNFAPVFLDIPDAEILRQIFAQGSCRILRQTLHKDTGAEILGHILPKWFQRILTQRSWDKERDCVQVIPKDLDAEISRQKPCASGPAGATKGFWCRDFAQVLPTRILMQIFWHRNLDKWSYRTSTKRYKRIRTIAGVFGRPKFNGH